MEDPFDSPTYHIPEKPVTFTEGASYTAVILVGLGVAAAAGYAVFKELIFEPKEYEKSFISEFIFCGKFVILVLMNLQSVIGTKYLARHWRRFKTIVRLEMLLLFCASTDVPVRTISLFGVLLWTILSSC